MLLGTISGIPDKSKRWVYRLEHTIVITHKLLEDEHGDIFSWQGYDLNNSFKYFSIISSERYTTE